MTYSTILKSALLLGGITFSMGIALSAPNETADQIIARARAYLGGDSALGAIKSVHYRGIMETYQGTTAGSMSGKYGVDIVYQKPYQQRIIATGSDAVETTALDGYVAWVRKQDLHNPTRWQVMVVDPNQIKALRANNWEYLNFFKDIEQCGGKVEVLGPATADGLPAVKLAFTHEQGIVFYRYFDPATGKLLFSETSQGGSIRLEGEIIVNGVRFPQKIIQISKGLDAKGQAVEQKQVVTVDQITLNEVFPAEDFELPLLSPSSPLPAAGPLNLPAVNPSGPPQAEVPQNPPATPGTAGK